MKKNIGNRTLKDVHELFDFKNDFINIIKNGLTRCKNIKMQIVIKCLYKKIVKLDERTAHHSTKSETITNDENLNDIFNNHVNKLIESINNYEGCDSGLILKSIYQFSIQFIKYNPLGAGRYFQTPIYIRKKNCTINIKNKNDNECFRYRILYHEHKDNIKSNPERISHYKNLTSKYKFDGINYPVNYNDKKFEKINNHEISINVFGYDVDRANIIKKLTKDKNNNYFLLNNMCNEDLLEFEYNYYKKNPNYKLDEIYVIRLTENYVPDNHINLLLISEENETEKNEHIIYIKNFEGLMRNQLNANFNYCKICSRCLNQFVDNDKERLQRRFDNHMSEYKKYDEVCTKLPTEEDNIIKFKNFKNKLVVPFSVYADFECCLEKKEYIENKCYLEKEEHIENDCCCKKKISKTIICQIHNPVSFCLKLVCNIYNDKKSY